MFHVRSVEETASLMKEYFSDYPIQTETLPIEEAFNRIIAQEVRSKENIPLFDRSSVDGYAVKAKDTFGASEAMPAQLLFKGSVQMGETPDFQLEEGECAYIPTGGELPQGADGIVMVEYSEDFDGEILLQKSVSPGENVVYKGDDVKEGDLVLQPGKRLRPQDIAVLASLGYSRVEVQKKLKIAIISTGDEIIPITETPRGAQVRDINSYGVYASALRWGLEPVVKGIVRDDWDSLEKAMGEAVQEADIAVISGGSSVGNKDMTAKIIDGVGEPGIFVHGIAVKPGKPTILAKAKGKALVGLPGHPASAFMIFNTIVHKLVQVMEHSSGTERSRIQLKMKGKYPSNGGREEYLPVQVVNEDGMLFAKPIFGKSGMISLMTRSDGYVIIPRGSEGLNDGQEVQVELF